MDVESMWSEYERHPGDREALFHCVNEELHPGRVVYPGSYIDVAASMVFDDVTYVDMDRRADRFFRDRAGVDAIIERRRSDGVMATWSFVAGDYTDALPLADGSFDLLVSLYAGLAFESCRRYLAEGGHLLANTSHGDVALASIDPDFDLVAVVVRRGDRYAIVRDGLEDRLIPKSGSLPTKDQLRTTMKGVAYTKPAAAYLFRRV